MKINPVSNINFTARKPEIRKADDIQRRARNEFPMLSSSYVNDFYLSTGKNSRITKTRKSLFNHLCDCVNKVRSQSEKKIILNCYIPYISRLNAVKKHKAGNCMEAAYATASALYANGYKNTNIGNLMYEAKFYNKRTKQLVHIGSVSLDHSFVMTDMNKGGEQNIIVDSWLGFADSKEGAISRYKKIKDDSTINKAIQLIATEIYSEYSVPIEEILEDFDVQGKFVLKKNDFIKEKDKNNIGNYIQEKYPKLVL